MKIGFTASAFDLLHAGHIIMLKECREHCDYLIAGLHINPAVERESKNVPVQSVVERYIQLRATKYVDEIIPYQTESDLLNILQTQNINIRFLGEEYSGKQFTGLDYCHENAIEIHFNSRKHPFSSSELRQRVGSLYKTLTCEPPAVIREKPYPTLKGISSREIELAINHGGGPEMAT